MIEVELQVPGSPHIEVVIRAVEDICEAHALACTLKSSLLSYPSGIHWHYEKAKQKETQEILCGKINVGFGLKLLRTEKINGSTRVSLS